MDLEFSADVLNTPSLITSSISLNPFAQKSLEQPNTNDLIGESDENMISDSSHLTTATVDPTVKSETLPTISNDINLSRIKDELKQSFIQPRKPTESPFQKMVKAGALTITPTSSTTDHTLPVEVPSTAEVVNDIESFSKFINPENTERETTTIPPSDSNIHIDTTTAQVMGVIVSPKKKLLYRSQSRTEPLSPTSIANSQYSQSQKANSDDSTLMDDERQTGNNIVFQSLTDLPLLISTGSNVEIDDSIKPAFTLQLHAAQNGVHPGNVKQHQQQQPIVINNKRTYQQALGPSPMAKSGTIHTSQQLNTNEVTSSSQVVGTKRQRATIMQPDVVNSAMSYSTTTNDTNASSDDQRKKQIRDSNREAARRCRERRRQYIEQLEGNLDQCKLQIKQLTDKLAIVERENTQLRAIITEAKLFHPATCLSSNDIEFSNAISASIDVSSESTDGNIIARPYFTRSSH